MSQSTATNPMGIQVLLERDLRGQWSAHSLELLSDARRAASRLDAGVGGWLSSAPAAPEVDSAPLAACGCRQLVHLTNERFAQRTSETIAAVLANSIMDGCRLVLLPGSAVGEEVAARLAAILGSVWIPDALALAFTRTGEDIEVTAALPDGKLCRAVRPAGEVAAVVTMRAGVAEIRRDLPVPVEVSRRFIDLDGVPVLTSVERLIEADPGTVDLAVARRIVAAGRGAGGPEGVALVAGLAGSLRASLGASRMAVDLGWVSAARQVGQTGRTVHPELYVACGISGASHHVVGMRDSKHIITINPDRKAPIHEVAHLRLHCELDRAIPALVAALNRRRAAQRAEGR